MENKIIFNADDFGISRGVNQAIFEAARDGILNSASVMANQKYAAEAVAMKQQLPHLELGLHVNLTNEYPAADAHEIPLLVGHDRKFKNGFVKLMLLSFFKPKAFKDQVYKEVEAQIIKSRKLGIDIKHIDSHRHVHMIPAIFSVFKELMQKYDIARVRTVKECGMLTLKDNKSPSFLFDGAIIKYYLLRFFDIVNGYPSTTYFYTMLYTCKLSRERFFKVSVPKGYDSVEIMIHPGLPEIDYSYPEDIFDENILSYWRKAELDTLMDKELLHNFKFDCEYPFVIRWYKAIENIWFRLNQKIRFLLVGGFNTVFAYGVFAFLFAFVGLNYLPALIVQYFITVNVSIFTMRYYVFRSRGDVWSEYCKAWGVYIGMFLFNSIVLTFLVEVCKVYELWAQAAYLVVSTVLTYLLHKYFSFYKKIKEK